MQDFKNVEDLEFKKCFETSLKVSEFIELCLWHPKNGYYTKARLGDDFITSPMICSLFGEIVALACLSAWDGTSAVHVLELGGGNGTLMSDMLMAWTRFPSFFDKIQRITFLEKSIPLAKLQISVVQDIPCDIISSLSDFSSDLFLMIIGNEFLDALPVDQFDGTSGKEQYIDHLRWRYPFETVEERYPVDPMIQINRLLTQTSGVAVLIDYGYTQGTPRPSTLQAVYQHKKVSLFEHLGQADLSHHVDFGRLQKSVSTSLVSDIMSQGIFLRKFGFRQRLEQIIPYQKDPMTTMMAAHRLLSSTEMGELFKVLWIQGSRIK